MRPTAYPCRSGHCYPVTTGRRGGRHPYEPTAGRSRASATGFHCAADGPEVIVLSEDSEPAPAHAKGPFSKLVSKNQSALFLADQRRLKNIRQKKYREKKKSEKRKNQLVNLECREKLGGPPKKSMRVRQYDLAYLKRIITVGTCPAARGALSPRADILSHVTCS